MNTWIKSAHYALRGIFVAAHEERNMKIHLMTTLFIVLICILIRISIVEFSLIFLCCALVICCELANSACERLIDSLKPRVTPQMATIKDMCAGCVFIASCNAAIVGIIILAPKIMSLALKALQTGILF